MSIGDTFIYHGHKKSYAVMFVDTSMYYDNASFIVIKKQRRFSKIIVPCCEESIKNKTLVRASVLLIEKK